eukprot:12880205-Prorocentrum_lima.AAC.1
MDFDKYDTRQNGLIQSFLGGLAPKGDIQADCGTWIVESGIEENCYVEVGLKSDQPLVNAV